MADDWEGLTSELRSLRQRRGLSLQSLARCPQLLAALNNPPLQEAYDALVSFVEQLGDDEPARALRQAYAIGMRHPKLLTERRADLHLESGRDPKTLASYENRMIAELASRILGTRKAEVNDSQVYVIADVQQHKLQRITVTVRFPADDSGDVFERMVEYENRSTAASLPALLYQLPHDWRPRHLILGVRADESSARLRYWTTAATELLALMFADGAQPVVIQSGAGIVQIDGPRPRVIYALYWIPA